MLPAPPHIFHGRESELQEIVLNLQKDSARIAILGTGGMGKTSLAIAALHDPRIQDKYANRHFVPCHSAPTFQDLASSIASCIRLEMGPQLAKRIVQYFTYQSQSLLVLDNFETPWESPTSRPEVEEFLSLLSDVPHVAIMITLRGAERPSKVKWTRPFLGPLKPLSNLAAYQTFTDIADVDDQDLNVQQLLDFTGNLPLAISLIANVAAYEGCENAIIRWKEESTHLLSDGYDKKSSLDISIMLSLSSTRMTSDAQDLLSLLSMLPDGLSDSDFANVKLPIPNILNCKTTLVRTALAYVDSNHRLKVLIPIREYVRRIHPPSSNLKFVMCEHFHNIIRLWRQFYTLPQGDIVPQISHNLGNLQSILSDALDSNSPNMTRNLATILHLNHFYRTKYNALAPLMLSLPQYINNFTEDAVYGLYLIERFKSSDMVHIPDPEPQIALGNIFFEHTTDVEKGDCSFSFSTHPVTHAQLCSSSLA
ncbi:P-loop containing nucleoside triphosphate hydrolase protein [Mycena rebaudengoi]|nr:P-loop containing nucleoside triphosphate hydrolase protein [Mycena rebaudengoi]